MNFALWFIKTFLILYVVALFFWAGIWMLTWSIYRMSEESAEQLYREWGEK